MQRKPPSKEKNTFRQDNNNNTTHIKVRVKTASGNTCGIGIGELERV